MQVRILKCSAPIVGWDGEALQENDPEKLEEQRRLRAERSPDSETMDITRPLPIGKFLAGIVGVGRGQSEKRAAQCQALAFLLAKEDKLALRPAECKLIVEIVSRMFKDGQIHAWTLGLIQFLLTPEQVDKETRERLETLYADQELVRVEEGEDTEPSRVVDMKRH